jgi:hypothetical protein
LARAHDATEDSPIYAVDDARRAFTASGDFNQAARAASRCLAAAAWLDRAAASGTAGGGAVGGTIGTGASV